MVCGMPSHFSWNDLAEKLSLVALYSRSNFDVLSKPHSWNKSSIFNLQTNKLFPKMTLKMKTEWTLWIQVTWTFLLLINFLPIMSFLYGHFYHKEKFIKILSKENHLDSMLRILILKDKIPTSPLKTKKVNITRIRKKLHTNTFIKKIQLQAVEFTLKTIKINKSCKIGTVKINKLINKL